MGEAIVILLLCLFSFIVGGLFGESAFRAQVIQEKHFCIESSTSGVDFKKCYRVEEEK